MPNDRYKKGAKSIKKAFKEGAGVWDKIKDFGSFAMRGKNLRDSLKEKEKTDKKSK